MTAIRCGVLLLALVGVVQAVSPPAAPAQGGAAEPPAALVLEVSGAITPVMSRHSQIPGHTALALGRDGRLTFVHYRTCRVVAVAGGAVRILPDRFEVEDGTIEVDRQRPCPRQQMLAIAGQAGVLVTRSLPPTLPLLAPEFRIVLVGPGGPRVSQGECTPQRSGQASPAPHPLAIALGEARPREALPPSDYVCQLRTGDGRGRASLSFRVADEPTAPDLLVLTVD